MMATAVPCTFFILSHVLHCIEDKSFSKYLAVETLVTFSFIYEGIYREILQSILVDSIALVFNNF